MNLGYRTDNLREAAQRAVPTDILIKDPRAPEKL